MAGFGTFGQARAGVLPRRPPVRGESGGASLDGCTRRSLLATLVVAAAVAGCDPGSPTPDELARGAELYQAHCVACHGGPAGGSISDIPPRHNAEGHTWHHADCDLVDIVNDGLPRRDGYPVMPAFGEQLTDDEIRLILEHLKTWWEPDQREFQAQVTDEVCG